MPNRAASTLGARETQPAFAVGDAEQTVLAPVGTAACVFVREVVPALTGGGVVLTHRRPMPLRQVRPQRFQFFVRLASSSRRRCSGVDKVASVPAREDDAKDRLSWSIRLATGTAAGERHACPHPLPMPTTPRPDDQRPAATVFARTERLRAREGGDFLTAQEVSTALTTAGIRHAIIGGHAMAAHGHVRNTEDVDVVAMAMTEAASVIATLRADTRVERRPGAMGCQVTTHDHGKLADVLDYFGSHAHRLAIDTAVIMDGIHVPRADALMAMEFAALTSSARPQAKRYLDLADLIYLVDRYHRGGDANEEVEAIARVVEADACGDPELGATRWRALHAAILAGAPITI